MGHVRLDGCPVLTRDPTRGATFGQGPQCRELALAPKARMIIRMHVLIDCILRPVAPLAFSQEPIIFADTAELARQLATGPMAWYPQIGGDHVWPKSGPPSVGTMLGPVTSPTPEGVRLGGIAVQWHMDIGARLRWPQAEVGRASGPVTR